MSTGQSDPVQTWSPNYGDRRGGVLPDMIVLHYTGMESAEAALERLCDPVAEVSCHYLIAGDGRIWQLVDEAQRAWHAGAGQWGGVTDVNSRSIGIELANLGTHPFAAPQMAALEEVMRGIMARWSIRPERVIAHSDMAPERKSDPGPRFDWRRLARQGLSIWPQEGDPQGQGFDTLATAFGYPPDAPQSARLRAFRDRFHPEASGPVSDADLQRLADLATRYPVDASVLNA